MKVENLVKAAVLVLACLAMALSIAPLVAEITPNQQTGASWSVECIYGSDGQLSSHTCRSGGDQKCVCP